MKKYLKAFAVHDDLIIERYEDDSIAIVKYDTLDGLSKIADEIGYKKDTSEWDKPYFANRLIEYIQRTDDARKKGYVSCVEDEDWAWWQSLPVVLKYILLYSFKEKFDEEGVEFPEWDGDQFEDSEFNLDDRSTDNINAAGWWLKNYIVGGYNEDGSFNDIDEYRVIVPRDAYDLVSVEKLAYLDHMDTLDFGDFEGNSFPDDIGSLTQLKVLNLCDNELDSPEEEAVKLHSLKNLESLWIVNTGIEDDEELLSQLKEALPNCIIKEWGHPYFR